MRIAFISFELPPETPLGGIGTYVHHAAKMLAQRGHEVEVIAGGLHKQHFQTPDGYVVHHVDERRDTFALTAGKHFAERHSTAPFDVLEGPDFLAEARYAVELSPNVPLIAKLHTPSALLSKISHFTQPPHLGLTSRIGSALRLLSHLSIPQKKSDIERSFVFSADEIAAPSAAIGAELSRLWKLSTNRIHTYPYPFYPSKELSSVDPLLVGKYATFLGRLEPRKGVIELAHAIRIVHKRNPRVQFRFIGRDCTPPGSRIGMRQQLTDILCESIDRVQFIDHISTDRLPKYFQESSFCIFPSRWENFPFVCLEAMSAGRAVIGSSAGGMAEMISSGHSGLLTDPTSIARIAEDIDRLACDSRLCATLGTNARSRISELCNPDNIGKLQERSYFRAINTRRNRPTGVRFP